MFTDFEIRQGCQFAINKEKTMIAEIFDLSKDLRNRPGIMPLLDFHDQGRHRGCYCRRGAFEDTRFMTLDVDFDEARIGEAKAVELAERHHIVPRARRRRLEACRG